MASRSAATRAKRIRAAEHLFAHRGFDRYQIELVQRDERPIGHNAGGTPRDQSLYS